MKKILNLEKAMFSVGIAACCCSSPGNAQDFIWASHLAVNNISTNANSNAVWTNNGKQVAVDQQGNTYATGRFECDSVTVTTTASGKSALFFKAVFTGSNTDGYLVKYDTAGEIIWTKQIGGVYGDHVSGPAIDNAGNIYITGLMNDVVDFNPGGTGGIVTANPYNDIFIAKYDNNGNFIWAKNFGGRYSESGSFIYLDTLGNLFISGGVLSDTINFNPGGTGGLLTPGGPQVTKLFIAKYDTAGNYKWATIIGNTIAVYGGYTGNFAVSPSGESYASGYLYGSVVLGSGQNTLPLNAGGFVAKFNADGNPEWVHNTLNARVRGITVDYNGDPIFTGSFSGTTANPFDLDFGSGSALFTPVGGSGSDIFLAKYRPDGSFVWAKNMGSASGDLGEDVAVDKANNIYTLSRYTGTANFNPGGNGFDILIKTDSVLKTSYGSTTLYDLGITKHSPEGDFYWVRGIKSAGAGSAQAGGIIVSNRGHISVTGVFSGTTGLDVNTGPDTLILRGISQDGFVVHLSCNDTTASFLSETLECGAPYTLNNEVYTAAGTYKQYLPNTAGCDSIITFELIYTRPDPQITIDVDTLSTIGSYNSYQWIKDSKLIAGATNAKLTISENGDYQVIVTNQYGCADTSEVYPVTNQEVSVDNIKAISAQVKVYPNPTQDELNIKSPVNVNIELTGIDGRTLMIKENAASVSVKGWANGIYFLKITDKEGRLIRVAKIVKE